MSGLEQQQQEAGVGGGPVQWQQQEVVGAEGWDSGASVETQRERARHKAKLQWLHIMTVVESERVRKVKMKVKIA